MTKGFYLPKNLFACHVPEDCTSMNRAKSANAILKQGILGNFPWDISSLLHIAFN